MGGRLSPVLACIFMEDLEERAIQMCLVAPRLYKCYVNDIVVIWDLLKGPYSLLLDILNEQNLSIHLTAEDEQNGSLPFLDLLITRPGYTGSTKRPYSLAVFQKPTHSDQYVHYKSAHPPTMKRAILRGLYFQSPDQWLPTFAC